MNGSTHEDEDGDRTPIDVRGRAGPASARSHLAVDDALGTWAACGAMALTGDPDGPPLAPATSAAAVLDAQLAPFGLDASVLGERAALHGFTRQGAGSCGGGARLLPGRDGWLALSLPRPTDLDLLPALLGVAPAADPWAEVAGAVAGRAVEEVEDEAATLGLAVAVVGGSRARLSVEGGGPVRPPGATVPAALVVDLSALWAGPLCADLLRRVGAEVVKVESTARPDGARAGPGPFLDLLNRGKASVALDLGSDVDRRRLHELVERADVVITSARSRAVDQLGLDPSRFLAGGRDRVWVAITAHGWASDRVGFGDDAAAAAGLVAWGDDERPRFAGDAIADPLCGGAAAEAAWSAWRRGGRWFVDAPLAGVARGLVAAPSVPATPARQGRDGRWEVGGRVVRTPRARAPEGPAAPLGADTGRILAGPIR